MNRNGIMINEFNSALGLIIENKLLLYGVFRFLIEFLREPDEHLGLFLKYFYCIIVHN